MLKINKPLLFITVLLVDIVVVGGLFYFGIIHFNSPSYKKYPVRGVDVSSYQGEINWDVLAQENITFAFIKATEGSSFIDKTFNYNWENAKNTELLVGAYHFFSFESSGKTQAEHFIATVGDLHNGSLPPVIDIEYYNKSVTKSVSKEYLRTEIKAMIETLFEHYGCRPILYVTQETYNDIIKGYFDSEMLWVRSVYTKPRFTKEDQWVIWQYSNRHRLKGYNGKEKYIDMNVFNGDLNDFYRTFSLDI